MSTAHDAPTSSDESGAVGPMPPQDLEAEQSVLGSMLLSTNAIGDVLEHGLTSRDFYSPAHAAVYERVLSLYGQGDPVDPVTAAAELERRGELARVGGASYLHTMIAMVPTAANASYYAEIVAEKAVLRRLIEAGTRIAQLGYRGGAGAELHEVVDRAQSEVHTATVNARSPEEGPVTGGSAASSVLADLADDTPRDLVQTGVADLDALTGGLEPGEITVVCGRPSHGKTLLGLQIARAAALDQGKHAFVFSMEMSRKLVMQRTLSAWPKHGVDLGVVSKKKPASNRDWQLLTEADAAIQTANLWIDDSSYQTTGTIRTTLRRHIQQHGCPDVVVLDYLGLIVPTGKSESRALDLASITRDLKILAGELGVAIVLVHQLNRNSTHRHDKRPTLADLRDSGAVEQDAFAVIGVNSPDADEPNPAEHRGESELIVLKNRQGKDGLVSVAWQPQFARFANMSRERSTPMDPAASLSPVG